MQEVERQPGRNVAADRVSLALVLGGFALALALCVPGALLTSQIWSQSDSYGHAYAIPAVALYLTYRNRERILGALRNPEPPALGAPLALLVALGETAFVIGDLGFPAGIGIPVLLAATAWALGGTPLLRPLLLPLGFLLFMVPPPRFLVYQMLFRLKLLVTALSVSLLHALDFSVVAEGNQIQVPAGALFVADACSGLTSIVTLLPLAAIVSYFLSRGVWRRVVIVAAVVPLAIAANVARVTITVGLVASYGLEIAQGVLHDTFGLGTYVVGTLALILIAKSLR